MTEFLGSSLQALSDLLKPPSQNDDSDSEDEVPATKKYQNRLGPGSIGPAKKSDDHDKEVADKTSSRKPLNSKDIWDADEVTEGAEYDDLHDPRPAPQYDILYKQSVSAEDMYLQMGNKTPATASCEDMLIKVYLPATRYSDVSVDLKDKFLAVRSPKYKLGLHLPHPVDGKNGRAQWDGDKCMLSVTARMTREYDFINF